MDMTQAQAWVAIIVGLTTAIVTVVTAFKVGRVHTLVNSNLTAKETEITLLRSMLVGAKMQADMAEQVRSTLAAAATLTASAAPHGTEPVPPVAPVVVVLPPVAPAAPSV